MKIGIDARLIQETGVGRYIRNLLQELSVIDTTNSYVIYVLPKAKHIFVSPNKRWTIKTVNIRWHTIAEQLFLPLIYLKDGLDILHIPYFTIPIFYPKKMVSTIHDLIILQFATGKATTLPYPFYLLKRIAYKIILEIGLRRVSTVISVSETTKKELIHTFHLAEKSIYVTYEGVDDHLLNVIDETTNVKNIDEGTPYWLYVGNAYPHKNLETFIESLVILHNDNPKIPWKLICVGDDNFFYSRIKKMVKEKNISERVVFVGGVSDMELKKLYKYAKALVFPSLNEGFGLPALEALALNCPVIVSDIPIFHEILPEFVTFISPYDKIAWSNALKNSLDDNKILWKNKEKETFFTKFSWKNLAKETLHIYERCNRI